MDYGNYPSRKERWEAQHKPQRLSWWAWLGIGVATAAIMYQTGQHPSVAGQAPTVQHQVVCPQAGTVNPQQPSTFAECQPVVSR